MTRRVWNALSFPDKVKYAYLQSLLAENVGMTALYCVFTLAVSSIAVLDLIVLKSRPAGYQLGIAIMMGLAFGGIALQFYKYMKLRRDLRNVGVEL